MDDKCIMTFVRTRGHQGGHVCVCSAFSDSVAPWTVAHQAPLSIDFLCKYWSGLTFSLPGALSDPEIESVSWVLYC